MPEKKSFQPARLDVDPSILDSNLMIVSNPEAEEMNSLFSSLGPTSPSPLSSLMPEDEFPSTTVIPKPGLCIKTKNSAGSKFFINLCKLNEIPPPPPLDEEELTRMIESDDYSSVWRVPMSLGAPRKEKDKSGVECSVAEVAVNTAWFDGTMVDSMVFTSFVVTVAMEGLADKYGEEARLDRQNWTILKNKKFLGETCPPHRIQMRSNAGIQQVSEGISGKKVLEVKEEKQVKGKVYEKPSKIKRDETNSKVMISSDREPKYRIVKHPLIDPVELVATVWLPGVKGMKEITLDIGEDRVVLVCTKQQYMLDIFLPYTFHNDGVNATYQKDEQVLSVTIPLMG